MTTEHIAAQLVLLSRDIDNQGIAGWYGDRLRNLAELLLEGSIPRSAPPQNDLEIDVWKVRVFQDEDRFAAEWVTQDGKEAGMGEYAATPIGALANLCATLIKVAEDHAKERAAAPALPGETT